MLPAASEERTKSKGKYGQSYFDHTFNVGHRSAHSCAHCQQTLQKIQTLNVALQAAGSAYQCASESLSQSLPPCLLPDARALEGQSTVVTDRHHSLLRV